MPCSFSLQLIVFFRTAVFWKLFDISFLYKHSNFSHVCLLIKMTSKTVTRSIIRVVRCTLSLRSFSNSLLRNYVLTLTYKSPFLRKSRITRPSSQNRIFYYFAKTSLLLTKLRKSILGFKRFILKQKL